MKLEDCFNEKGYFIDNFNPFRDQKRRPDIFSTLFEELYGDYYLRDGVEQELMDLVKTKNFSPWSDCVAVIHANTFADNTKGNYSLLYYWR